MHVHRARRRESLHAEPATLATGLLPRVALLGVSGWIAKQSVLTSAARSGNGCLVGDRRPRPRAAQVPMLPRVRASAGSGRRQPERSLAARTRLPPQPRALRAPPVRAQPVPALAKRARSEQARSEQSFAKRTQAEQGRPERSLESRVRAAGPSRAQDRFDLAARKRLGGCRAPGSGIAALRLRVQGKGSPATREKGY